MVKDYSKVIPYHSVENDCLIGGNGDVTIGFNILLPEVFTLTVDSYNNIHESLINLFKRLPVGTVVHKQDFYWLDKFKGKPKSEDLFTRKSDLNYYDQRPVLKHTSKLYVTFSQKTSVTVSDNQNSFIKAFDYLTKKPFNEVTANMKLAIDYSNTILNDVKSLHGFNIKRMSNDTLLCSVYDYINQSYQTPGNDVENLVLQPMEVNKGFTKYGHNYLAMLSLVKESGKLNVSGVAKTAPNTVYDNGNYYSNTINLPSSLTYPLGLGLPIDHVLNVSFEILDNEDIISHMSTKGRNISVLAMFNQADVSTQQAGMSDFVNNVSKYGFQSTRTSINVVLSDTDPDNLKQKIDLCKSAFANMNGSVAWSENLELANLFWSTLPGNAKTNYRGMLHILDQSVAYLPIETHYKGDSKGFMFVDRVGTPVVVDLWDSPYLEGLNKNKLIFGPSGTGKSYLINGFLDQSIYQNHHVVMIDIGHSYKKLCDSVGGLYFDTSNKQNLSFNIFLCPKDEKGNYQYVKPILKKEDEEEQNDVINFVYTVLVCIWKPNKVMDEDTTAVLMKLIIGFYEHVNDNRLFPDFDLFYKYIDIFLKKSYKKEWDKYFDKESFKLILEKFTSKGEHPYLLNSQQNIDLTKEKFIVFDVEALQGGNKVVFNLIMVIIIELILDKARKLVGTKKSFYIDEGLDFLMSDMSLFIAYLYRIFRKKNGEVCLATQDVDFLRSLNEIVKNSIITNTSTYVLLDHSNNRPKYKSFVDLISFTDDEIRQLDSLEKGNGYREFLIKMANVTRVFRMNVSPESSAMYLSNARDNYIIYKLFDINGNLEWAIKQYLESKEEIYQLYYDNKESIEKAMELFLNNRKQLY